MNVKQNYIETECSECGVKWEIYKYNLAKKKTTMCSKCVYESRIIHDTDTKRELATKYTSMMQRCYNKNNPVYEHYGGKGVTVCKEWRDSKTSYIQWCIDNGYHKNMHLDKDILSSRLKISPPIYSPKTCMFVTAKENSTVKTSSRMITYKGKTKCLSDWATELRIEYKTLQSRIDNYGFSVEEALTKPTGSRYGAANNKAVVQISMDGNTISEYKTAREADRQTGISYKNISNALRGKSKSAGGFKWKYKLQEKEGLQNG